MLADYPSSKFLLPSNLSPYPRQVGHIDQGTSISGANLDHAVYEERIETGEDHE